MQLIYIIPISIIISTVITLILLTKGLNVYVGKIEKKTQTIQRISLLLIASDFVTLFSSSESKRLVENIIRAEDQEDESVFNSLSNSFGGAGSEIERLHKEINKAYKPSEDLSRIKLSAVYLKTILLFYGLVVSISQFLIAYFFDPTKSILFSQLSSDLFVATFLFSLIVIYISVYIVRVSRRIEIRYARLESAALPST